MLSTLVWAIFYGVIAYVFVIWKTGDKSLAFTAAVIVVFTSLPKPVFLE